MRLHLQLEDLGPRDDLLLKAAGEAAGVPIHNLCNLPNSEPALPIHFYAAAQPGMAVKLPSIRLNTYWTSVLQSDQPIIVPAFNPSQAIDRSLDWTPPDNCAIYIVVRGGTPYLIALGVHPTKGHWMAIRLDLPNLYDDARICMGNEWRPPEGGSYVERLRKYVDSVYTSRWNNHLMGGPGDTTNRWDTSKKLVRFSPDGKVLPPLVPWYECGKEVSSAQYNWLVAMAQNMGKAP